MFHTVMTPVDEAASGQYKRANLISMASPESVKHFTESRLDVRELIDQITASRIEKLNGYVSVIFSSGGLLHGKNLVTPGTG
jgi:hypothetical protein